MNLRKRTSPLVVFVLIVAVAATVALLLPAYRGATPADLRFVLLDGRTPTLAELRGRPALIAFWATSCAPCVEEVPDLIALYRQFAPQGLELIAVAMPFDSPLHVQTFVKEKQLPYPVALDVDGAVVRAFDGVSFIPAAVLMDPDGRIVYRQQGKLDIDRARRLIASLLPKPPG